MTHILAFHAHPDDIETLAAGTLALLAANGHRITIATMTAGDCGAVDTSLEETARIRRGEAAAAAAMIGADYRCAGVGDLCVFNDDFCRRRTVETIRAVQPEVVITGSPADYHPDHEATSILVRDACFASTVKNYVTGAPAPLAQIPYLYFMDSIDGRDRQGKWLAPDFAVDVSAHMDVKRAMLNCHASQVRWVDRQHGISNFTQAMERFSAKVARPFGVAYAEGFRQYTGTPYPRGDRLQDLVGAALLKS
ncbi:MAG: PIG-L family deacetylase [Alphaproteobacteria bacterium]|nr:PIG-L family deacetylase [Alphaproteobacteria bacterium]MBL7096275.1 PIG-L family deacetylase [Alphaproteobacteria bacterium]